MTIEVKLPRPARQNIENIKTSKDENNLKLKTNLLRPGSSLIFHDIALIQNSSKGSYVILRGVSEKIKKGTKEDGSYMAL